MSGEITHVNGLIKRPSWNYSTDGKTWRDVQIHHLEMLESCRNVMEDVLIQLRQLNVLLNCSNFLSIPRSLRKIARNTERKPRTKKVKQSC